MAKSKKYQPKRARSIAILIAGLLVIGLIVYGIVAAIRESSIPEFNDGSELSVVKLTTHGGIQYEWSNKIEDETIAEIYDVTSSARDNTDGGIVDLQYIFKGKKPGTTYVTFKYGSFANGNPEETRKYKIEVNRNLEIRLIEQ